MKIYGAIRTAIHLALTVLVLVFVATLAEIEVLRYFIGGLIAFYGVEEIVYTAFKNKKHYHLPILFWNVIEIVMGLVLIVFVETGDVEVTYAVVCVSWAIWAIFREARELYELIEEVREHRQIVCRIVSILNLLESLTAIAFSLTMIIEPGEHHAKIHLYLLAVELFTKVTFPIVYYIAERVTKKKKGGEPELAAAESEVALSAEGGHEVQEVQKEHEAQEAHEVQEAPSKDNQ